MKPVDQIEFREGKGDCFRACLASILEFEIKDMPNFWEETDSAATYFEKTNQWLRDNFNCTTISIQCFDKQELFFKDVLCIAIGNINEDEEHAVVWKNKTIHDPNPYGQGLKGEPKCFVFLIPIDPLQKTFVWNMSKETIK